MIYRKLRLITSCWRHDLVRYTIVHSTLGVINFGLAALLFTWYGLNHHVASLIGHGVHVGVGFFVDRRISFRSPDTSIRYGIPRYWIIEGLSYVSIVLTMFIMIDIWNANPYISRGVVAMGVASLISYSLNRLWTFKASTI